MAGPGLFAIAETTLRQNVSPQVVAQSQILELSADELADRVREELEENPALEVADEALVYPLSRSVAAVSGERLEALDNVRAPYSLLDDLRLQLAQVSRVKRRLCERLLDYLDERGFLDLDAAVVARRLGVGPFELEGAIQALQGLEPAGIGARSLRECLLLQIRRLPTSEVPPGTVQFINTYLNTARRQSPRQAAEFLHLTDHQLAAILRFVGARLYMWPADCFRDDLGDPPAATPVVPDAWISTEDGSLRVRVAQSWSRSLRVNEAYARLDEEWKRATGASSDTERERLADKVRTARDFIHFLARREAVLKRVTEAIIKRQRQFFRDGDGALCPLTRKEVAAMLRVHESTISRVTRGKFVQLPDERVVPYDFFFDGSLAPKDELAALIAAEDPARPWSDADLAGLMQERGHVLARRTVAKYRDALRIPPVHLRKRLPATA